MRRSVFSGNATILGLILLLAAFAVPAAADEANIVVQPHTLAMQSLGGTVSVHTDIEYGAGAPWTATLNGLEAYLCKSDLRGNLVAKFNLEAVKAMAEGSSSPQLTLSFVAIPSGAEGTFTGTDSITITRKLDRN
jgi:hypothetical protein